MWWLCPAGVHVMGWEPKISWYGVIHKYGFNLSFHMDVCPPACNFRVQGVQDD